MIDRTFTPSFFSIFFGFQQKKLAVIDLSEFVEGWVLGMGKILGSWLEAYINQNFSFFHST